MYLSRKELTVIEHVLFRGETSAIYQKPQRHVALPVQGVCCVERRFTLDKAWWAQWDREEEDSLANVLIDYITLFDLKLEGGLRCPFFPVTETCDFLHPTF